jgi:transposase-like protein
LGFGKQTTAKVTHPHQHSNLLDQLVNQISAGGVDAFAESLRLLLNHAMEIERSKALGAAPYERTNTRKGYANGFKSKTLKTRLGELCVDVPQVRGEIDFYPSALERGQRSERALTLAIAEMYVQGVSTRRVSAILCELAGTLEISSTQVSRAAAQLDEQLELWRQRPLNDIAFPYLILDARYEKVRRDGAVVDCAVLLAIGIDASGQRAILGVSTALSEAQAHWSDFLASLQERGLHGTSFIVSDDHPGLRAARIARFPGVLWQRCQFHLQQNASQYVPKLALRPTVAAELREILHAQSRPQAEAQLKAMVSRYRKSAPELSAWLENNVPESLSVFSLPKDHRPRLRTSNAAERLSQEIKRRTRVVRVFPHTKSLLRLVSALLLDISDDWESSPSLYLNMNLPKPFQAP